MPDYNTNFANLIFCGFFCFNRHFSQMTRTRGRADPKRGRPGGVKNQDFIRICCFFKTFLAAKVPGLAQVTPVA